MQRRAVVAVYVRHAPSCPSIHRGEFYRGCPCSKWLRYSLNGKRHRQSAQTRTWVVAEEKAVELQEQLAKGGAILVRIEPDRPTVEQSIETFLEAKRSEGVSPRRVKKLDHQLTLFEHWMTGRGKFYPHQMTSTDVIEFRSTWDHKWRATTRQNAQQNLRSFLRTCCRDNLTDLLAALRTIRLSRADKTRLEPKPLSEEEIKILLTQLPRSLPKDAEKADLLIRFMIATGVAIRDAVQLERKNIQDGWLRISRQKTTRPVRQHIDAALCRELLELCDGEYIFWDKSKMTIGSAVTKWEDDIRLVMQDAKVWITGNTTHRFRDTFVDWQLGEGSSLTDIAAMLGNTLAVTERHYADLASKRMEHRLTKLPKRAWDKADV
jgi:integrase